MGAFQVDKQSYITEDLEIFRDTVGKFFERECVLHVGEWNKRGVVDREAWES